MAFFLSLKHGVGRQAVPGNFGGIILWLLLGTVTLVMFVNAQADFPTVGFPTLDFALGTDIVVLEGNDRIRSLVALLATTLGFATLTFYFSEDARFSMVSAVAFIAMPTTTLAFVVVSDFVVGLTAIICVFSLIIGLFNIYAATFSRSELPDSNTGWLIHLVLVLLISGLLVLLQYLNQGPLINLSGLVEMAGPALLILSQLILFQKLNRPNEFLVAWLPFVVTIGLAGILTGIRAADGNMGWQSAGTFSLSAKLEEAAFTYAGIAIIGFCAVCAVLFAIEAKSYCTESGDTAYNFNMKSSAFRFLDKFSISLWGLCILGSIGFAAVGQIFAASILVSLGFARCIALLDAAALANSNKSEFLHQSDHQWFYFLRHAARLSTALLLCIGGFAMYFVAPSDTNWLPFAVFCSALFVKALVGLFAEKAQLYYVAAMTVFLSANWVLLTTALPGLVHKTYPRDTIIQAVAPYRTCGTVRVFADGTLSPRMVSHQPTPFASQIGFLKGHDVFADYGQTVFHLRRAPETDENILGTIIRRDWQRNAETLFLAAKAIEVSPKCRQWIAVGLE